MTRRGCNVFHGHTHVSATTIDFDYEAPNPGSRNYRTDLPSVYDKDMPAGLRGEAVRSALRSGRCIGWSLHGTPLQHGLVQVQGTGCVNFLNNKLSNSFVVKPKSGNDIDVSLFNEAALLTARGRMIDRVGVAVTADGQRAWIQTSPRHTATDLFSRLDPFVFPLDQVQLQAPDVFGFALASIRREHVVRAFEKTYNAIVQEQDDNLKNIKLPTNSQECLCIMNDSDGSLHLLVVPTVNLPDCAAVGYTFWWGNKAEGQAIWQSLTNEKNTQGPVAIGSLEYESLRIQSGMVGFDREMTGRREKDKDVAITPATPMELHQAADTIDLEKGCYMGQEGIASVLKNPRGPPRLLYQVVFHDEFNLYDSETTKGTGGNGTGNNNGGSRNTTDNLTRLPQPGDVLYVLGSNEEINVGALTSVAEPASTGDPETLALALVRRSDSILQAMQKLGLEIPRVYDVTEQDGSGVIQPPPMDPLDGLEVILEGSFTVGTLRSIPRRRLSPGRNMFVEDIPDFVADLSAQDDRFVDVTRVPLAGGRIMGDVYEPRRAAADSGTPVMTKENEGAVVAEWERDDTEQYANTGNINEEDKDDYDDDDDEAKLEEARVEAEAAQKAAEAAAAEAERKAAKMEMLRKRAEEALDKRKAKKSQGNA